MENASKKAKSTEFKILPYIYDVRLNLKFLRMEKKTVIIKYVKSHDFKTSLATGVYGGLTSNGMINANFFTDRVIIPTHQSLEIDEEGKQQGSPKDIKDGDFVREVQFGALMDINSAKVIVAWLDSKIAEFEKSFPSK